MIPARPASAARTLHIGAAAVWLGLIWFVNFIQLPVIGAANDADRGAIVRLVVPHVAATFHMAAHLTLISGALLMLLPSGAAAFSGGGLRAAALWLALAGGVAMWAVVQFGIVPRVAVLTDPSATPDAKARAVSLIRLLARANLALSVPVTALMIAAAHLH